MEKSFYPALFRCADDASDKAQRTHINLILSEYGLLFLAAVFSMSVFSGTGFYVAYALVFVALIGVLLLRAFLKPVQHWYQCRAFAESVKTMAWRYMMCAPPFDSAGTHQTPRDEFSQHLRQMLDANRQLASSFSPDWSAEAQITREMDRVRHLDWQERLAIYVEQRIDDQAGWYAREATSNRNAAKKWVAIGVGAYVVAASLALLRIAYPDWTAWPIEPVIVFASSIIGWVQIKKFSELAAAYGATAQENGLIRVKAESLSPEKLAEFVTEAELAFSREHTSWIARQTT